MGEGGGVSHNKLSPKTLFSNYFQKGMGGGVVFFSKRALRESASLNLSMEQIKRLFFLDCSFFLSIKKSQINKRKISTNIKEKNVAI